MPYNVTIREPADGLDTSPYTPSHDAYEYSRGDFEGTEPSYYISILSTRGAITLAIGIILLLHIAIWNCASCCCKNGCCKAKKLSSMCKVVVTVFLIGFTLGGIISLSLLLENGESQDALVGKLAPALDYLAYGFEDTAATVERASKQSVDCSAALNASNDATNLVIATALFNMSNYTSDIDTAYEAASTAFATLTDTLDTVAGTFNETDLFFKDAAVTAIESVNDTRKTAFLGLIVFILAICLLQILVSFMNMWAPPKYQPRKCCWVLLPLTTLIYLLAFLAVWILCTVLLVTTTVLSDFCVAPDAAISDLGSTALDLNGTLDYYLKCDDQSLGLVNPLQGELDNITSELTQGKLDLDEFADKSNLCNYVNATTFGIDCSGIDEANAFMVTQCGLTADYISEYDMEAVVVGTNARPFKAGSVFGQTNCVVVNARYQMILHLVCDDLLGVFAKAFAAFLSVGVLMYLIEATRKYSRGRKKEDEDDDDYDKKSAKSVERGGFTQGEDIEMQDV